MSEVLHSAHREDGVRLTLPLVDFDGFKGVESPESSLELNLARSAAAAPSAALLLFIGTDVTFGASVRIQVAQVRPRPDRVPEGEIRPLEAARPTSTVCQKLGMEPKFPLGDRELLLLPPQPHAATRGERARNG